MNAADVRLNNYFKDLQIFTTQECSYIKKQKNTLSQSLENTLNPKTSQHSTNYYFVYSLLSEDNLHMKKQDFSQPEKHTCKPSLFTETYGRYIVPNLFQVPVHYKSREDKRMKSLDRNYNNLVIDKRSKTNMHQHEKNKIENILKIYKLMKLPSTKSYLM